MKQYVVKRAWERGRGAPRKANGPGERVWMFVLLFLSYRNSSQHWSVPSFLSTHAYKACPVLTGWLVLPSTVVSCYKCYLLRLVKPLETIWDENKWITQKWMDRRFQKQFTEFTVLHLHSRRPLGLTDTIWFRYCWNFCRLVITTVVMITLLMPISKHGPNDDKNGGSEGSETNKLEGFVKKIPTPKSNH